MNKVCLIGRICRDVEVKTIGSTQVSNFSIAQNLRIKDKDEPQFFNCVAFGKTAELLGKYFKKGSQIGIEGSLRYESYNDKDGKKLTAHKVIVEAITFLDKKTDAEPEAKTESKAEESKKWKDDVPF